MSSPWAARRRARLLFETAPRDLRPRRTRPMQGAALPRVRHGPVRDAAVAVGLGRFGAVSAERKAAQSRARAIADRLPLVAELLAACLAAGSGPDRSAEAVGRSVGGQLGDGLVRAAVELRLGDEPEAVWARFADRPGCEVLARCMERAGAGGVPAIRDISRVARESRARRARSAAEAARRAAVLITGPLGLCFLPAFLAIGVAPVVVGLARSLL